MSTTAALDLSVLITDRDTLELEDGRLLRLRVEFDDYHSIMDEQGEGAWFGKLAFAERGRFDDYERRPDGFTGGAEKLRLRECNIWWEVPDDLRKPEMAETKRAVRTQIIDNLEWGYRVLILELCEGRDYYGRPIVIDSASIAGVDAFPTDAEIIHLVSDLASELLD